MQQAPLWGRGCPRKRSAASSRLFVRACEGDFGDALGARERGARLCAEAVDDVQHARRQEVPDELDKDKDGDGGGLGGLEDDGVAGGEGRGELPCSHLRRGGGSGGWG